MPLEITKKYSKNGTLPETKSSPCKWMVGMYPIFLPGRSIFRGHVSFRRVNRKSKRMGVLGAGDFELLPRGNKVIDAIIHDESWWIIPIQYLILGGILLSRK